MMFIFKMTGLWDMVRFAPEMGGEEGALAPPEDATPPPSDPPPPPPNGSGTPPADGLYYPDGLSDEFKGMSNSETIDKLHENISSRLKPPETANDYKLELSEEQTQMFGELNDDEVYPIVRDIAHKAGLDNAQFNTMFVDLHSELMDKGFLDTIDPMAQLEKLKPDHGTEPEKMQAAARRMMDVSTQVDGLVNRSIFSKEDGNILLTLTDTAEGTVALEKLFKSFGGHGLQSGGETPGGYSWDQHDQDIADPRYSTRSDKHDVYFRSQVDQKVRLLGPRKKP